MSEGNSFDPYAAQRSDSNLPIPDPTRLTTQLVDRALAAFREVVETRLREMDKATALVAENVEKNHLERDRDLEAIRRDYDRLLHAEREFILSQIQNVISVADERFAAIKSQFVERDTRAENDMQQSRISLDAALAAAKEAVSEQNKANALAIGKSEDATKERLDALQTLMTSGVQSLDDKISEIRSRIDRGEAGGEGRTAARVEQQAANVDRRGDLGLALLALSIVIAAITLAIAFAK
jgi:D-ribose pyranose/furanose isomerase RbsD